MIYSYAVNCKFSTANGTVEAATEDEAKAMLTEQYEGTLHTKTGKEHENSVTSIKLTVIPNDQAE